MGLGQLQTRTNLNPYAVRSPRIHLAYSMRHCALRTTGTPRTDAFPTHKSSAWGRSMEQKSGIARGARPVQSPRPAPASRPSSARALCAASSFQTSPPQARSSTRIVTSRSRSTRRRWRRCSKLGAVSTTAQPHQTTSKAVPACARVEGATSKRCASYRHVIGKRLRRKRASQVAQVQKVFFELRKDHSAYLLRAY